VTHANLWIFADFGTTLEAFGVFSLFAIVPGYVAGWLTDVCGFRTGSALRQAALTVPLSISVLPILIYLPWRFLSIAAVWLVMAAVGVAFLTIMAMELREARRRLDAFRFERRAAWTVGVTAVALWLLIALGSLLDLRIGNRLYFSVTTFDYLSRVPMANSIAHQDKLPAITPFLTLPEPVQLRYHYFWPMVCGLVTVAGHGAFTARDATTAGALWAGIALLCLIAVYLRIFHDVDPSRWRAYAIGLALLGVTGLDILPVLQYDYEHRHAPAMILATTEWWNEQVTGWLDAMLWVPHHMAALVACLTAFLLLWRESQRADHQPRTWPRVEVVILAALALASAVGMSIFVAFTFAMILAVWALLELLRRRPQALLAVAAAGVLSLVVALPFLLELRPSDPRSSQPASSPIQFQVRRFGLLPDHLEQLGLMSPEQSLSTTFYRLLFLPLNYFLELGVYFYVGVLFLRRLSQRRPISSRDLAAVAMLATSVTVCTFLASSTVAAANDLGSRGFMAAQFILLLWTVELVESGDPGALLQPKQYRALMLLLALGVSSTLLDLTLLRGYNRFMDSSWFTELGGMPNADLRLGERSAARADTYAWVRDHTPANAVVQGNPDPFPIFAGLFAERPALAGWRACEAFTGRDVECGQLKSALRPFFNAEVSPPSLPDFCRAFPLDMLVVTDADPVWQVKDSWIGKYRPVYGTEFSRVFWCLPFRQTPKDAAR
jgi:hypothetical protein